MNLRELEEKYINGGLNKHDYIGKMYTENHDILFDYSTFIKDRDIEKVEILADKVIITSKELGIKILCNRYDERIAPIEILNFRNYEKNDSDMIFRLVNDSETIFDIGGNMGWYSIGLSKVKKNVNIHTFEPIPSTYESLVKNAEINDSKIIINNFGLSDIKQDLTFYFHKEGSGNASSAMMNEERENIEVKCHVDTIDNYCYDNNIQQLDFIKCDVEGAELLTFKGGIKTIKEYKPIIFAELLRKWSAKFDYHPNEVIELLKSIGYKCFFVNGNRLQKIERISDDTIETNFFFLHQEKHILQIGTISND